LFLFFIFFFQIHVNTFRDGMFVNEHWEDGISFHNLKQRQVLELISTYIAFGLHLYCVGCGQSDLKAQKEALEREKAEFARIKRQKSRKTNSAVEDDGFVRPMDPLDDEAAEQDEIFRLRAAHLKKVQFFACSYLIEPECLIWHVVRSGREGYRRAGATVGCAAQVAHSLLQTHGG
jgi:hypothetical protein